MSIKKLLAGIFLLVATFYTTDAAFKLMTYPNDLTFIAGLTIVALTTLFWVDMIVIAVKKVLKSNHGKKDPS